MSDKPAAQPAATTAASKEESGSHPTTSETTPPAPEKTPSTTTTTTAMLKRENDSGEDDEERDSKRQHTTDDGPPWTEWMHRSLVQAIYEVGLKHASPSIILEKMSNVPEAVTSERVKSRLQKYRNNKDKSKQEFLAEYDAWLQKALTVGGAGGGGGASDGLASPRAVLDMVGSDKLLGGDMAAFLTYSVMQEDGVANSAAADAQDGLPDQPASYTHNAVRTKSQEYAKHYAGAKVPFPVLTEEERKTPLGSALGHVIGIFYSMTQHLMEEREAKISSAATVTSGPLPPPTSMATVQGVNYAATASASANVDYPGPGRMTLRQSSDGSMPSNGGFAQI